MRAQVFDINSQNSNKMRKARWEEEDPKMWGGACPDIEILYDEMNSFLWEVAFIIDAKISTFREPELLATFIGEFEKRGIWREDGAEDDRGGGGEGEEGDKAKAEDGAGDAAKADGDGKAAATDGTDKDKAAGSRKNSAAGAAPEGADAAGERRSSAGKRRTSGAEAAAGQARRASAAKAD
jgi:hypothetical protein